MRTGTYRAVDPRVAVHPPDGLGADGLAEDGAELVGAALGLLLGAALLGVLI